MENILIGIFLLSWVLWQMYLSFEKEFGNKPSQRPRAVTTPDLDTELSNILSLKSEYGLDEKEFGDQIKDLSKDMGASLVTFVNQAGYGKEGVYFKLYSSKNGYMYIQIKDGTVWLDKVSSLNHTDIVYSETMKVDPRNVDMFISNYELIAEQVPQKMIAEIKRQGEILVKSKKNLIKPVGNEDDIDSLLKLDPKVEKTISEVKKYNQGLKVSQ